MKIRLAVFGTILGLFALACGCSVQGGRPERSTGLNEKGLPEPGDALGLVMHGVMYSRGEGVPQDLNKAAEYFLKAMEQGDADAMGLLRRTFGLCEAFPFDPVQKRMHMLQVRTREEKISAGLALLARMHELGRGVPKDEPKAQELLERAAEIGNGKVVEILTFEEIDEREKMWKAQHPADP